MAVEEKGSREGGKVQEDSREREIEQELAVQVAERDIKGEGQ